MIVDWSSPFERHWLLICFIDIGVLYFERSLLKNNDQTISRA